MNVPAAPPKDPRQRRHRTKTIHQARCMYGDGDAWTPTQIRTYLAERGTEVSINTVRLWVIPGLADEQRKANMASYHRRQGRQPSETPVLDRMLELRRAGLPFRSIAAVVRLDLGIPLGTEQTRYYVNERREPAVPKRKALAQLAPLTSVC